MKTSILICSLALSGFAIAEFETWTSSDGRSAELELKKVTVENGEKVGQFRMGNGKPVRIPASKLTQEDAKRLDAWIEPEGGTPDIVPKPSVFDKELDGKLIKLDGKSLKKIKEFKKPTKYYLFYYTASWCGPCQKFTPSLVDFYNKNKNDEFEIGLISSDNSEDAMEGYAQQKEMPWPHLKLREVDDFKKQFSHPGGGIPNLVLTDLEGNLLKTSYEGKDYKGPNVVMNHLGGLLKN
jgi:thiol-disulfide isomerase/thioredoxin